MMLLVYRQMHDHRPVFLLLGAALLLYAAVLHAKRIYPGAKIVPGQPAR
jgi:hypothetical protein